MPNITRIESEDVITYTWQHPSEKLISHYILTVNAPGLENQTVKLITGKFFIPNSPDVEYIYSGEVRAVSICGDESQPLPFSGMRLSQIQYLALQTMLVEAILCMGGGHYTSCGSAYRSLCMW